MNEFSITGTITKVLPEASGVSKTTGNAWRKQEAVISTGGQYPDELCFTMFGDNIMPLEVGKAYTVKLNLRVNEYEGRYYNRINAWRIEPVVAQQAYAQPQQAYAPQQAYQQPQQPQSSQGLPPADDLPF